MRPLGLGNLSLSLCIAIIYSSTTMVVGQVPVLNTVFPVGGQIGKSVDITISGSNLTTTDALRCSLPGVHSERLGENRFRLSIPNDAPPGIHDLWASSIHGISAPRSFVVSGLNEFVDIEPKEANAPPTPVELDSVINGVIGAASDIDAFQIQAKKDQRILIECLAERIDSRLRPVLAVHDHTGRRLAVNRGHLGSDALIDFHVPADGMYVIKIQDLILSGSPEHVYRLEIDTGPRVAFSVPAVVEAGKAARVRLFGWNLNNHRVANSNTLEPTNASSSGLNSTELSSNTLTNNVSDGRGLGSQQFEQSELDSIEVDLTAAQTVPVRPLPVRLYPAQAILAGAAFPFYYPGSQAPVIIGLSDIQVSLDQADNQTPESAQTITVPCEISGQLVEGDQRDWFALEAKRGEVFWMEALGQRLAAPVDLQIGVFDAQALNAKAEEGLANSASRLALFSDEPRNVGGLFATNHLDPSGKWVCPADGRYLVVIQNLSGGMQPDPRRVYRLSIRREEPDFQIVAVPQLNSAPGASNGPAALNVMAGSRAVLEILVVRRRGWSGPIRVFAKDLPKGIECPDVWLGPDTDQTVMIVTASQDIKRLDGELHLEAEATVGNRSIGGPVSSGTIVRSGRPTGWGRILAKLPLAVIPNTTSDSASKSPARTALQISANGHEEIHHQLYGTLQARHSPGGILDVAVHIERGENAPATPVKLLGIGLSKFMQNQTATIPPEQSKGYLSFHLPPTMPVGQYSLAIRAETTLTSDKGKPETVVAFSNPVTIDVQPAAFVVEPDPFAVKKARRGETIQIAYAAKRINGFIGKMHTELAAPGCVTDVEGLRGRGETFVGQTDTGSLQIVVNDDAPLGPSQFLRLFTVGVVEDEPIYHGSSFLSLEIVK